MSSPVTLQAFGPGYVVAGKYRILRRLGGGGIGDVYAAEQTVLERLFAIKVLRGDVLSTPGVRELFLQEARISSAIGSNHIVQVFDADVDQPSNMPFLVMELLEGQDLRQVVEARGPLPASDVVKFVKQTARGLDKAHAYKDRSGNSRPIVHRDLKPENLFLTQSEEGEALVKILDFGIAKILSTTKTRTQVVRGTPLYCAPEQYELRVVPQTDIWALGLTALFLLTGRYYWKSAYSPEGTSESLMRETLLNPLVAPSQRLTELGFSQTLSPEFDAWFLGCVAREPEKRFATAGAAAAALELALRSPAVASGERLAPEIRYGELEERQPAIPADPVASPAQAGAARGAEPEKALIGATVELPQHMERNVTNTERSLALSRSGADAAPKLGKWRLAGLTAMLALAAMAIGIGLIRNKSTSTQPEPAPAAAPNPQPLSTLIAAPKISQPAPVRLEIDVLNAALPNQPGNDDTAHADVAPSPTAQASDLSKIAVDTSPSANPARNAAPAQPGPSLSLSASKIGAASHAPSAQPAALPAPGSPARQPAAAAARGPGATPIVPNSAARVPAKAPNEQPVWDR